MTNVLDSFIHELHLLRLRYAESAQIDGLKADLYAFAGKYADYWGIGDRLLAIAEEYISNSDYMAGMAFITTAEQWFPHIGNKTTLYLRLAEYHIESGKTDRGIEYLIKLCTQTADNYEDSIAINELTAVWEKYKPLVAGKVPESVSLCSAVPLHSEECTRQIHEILALPEDEILSALSAHLGELSANGERLQNLNKWEKNFFYADELCMEVNSGGFEGYLYYHGLHFEKAKQAFQAIVANEILSLMDTIQSKFPKNRIPKSVNSLQNTLERMEEKGIDFETEDAAYYSRAEKELLQKLLLFVLQNKDHFR